MTVHTLVAPATPEAIARAAGIIRAGGLVAFPTETVYGLGANALDADAVARIYHAKERALNDPLIVHIADWDELDRLINRAVLSAAQAERVEALQRAFWPGPLTLVLPRSRHVPPIVSAGLDTVAVRMPDHPVAQALIRRSGLPIAAPSANRFGHVSPTTAQHVLDDLAGRIEMVLDAGPTHVGVESTVLDLTHARPRILRPGGVTRARIAAVIGDVAPASADKRTDDPRRPMPSPGMLDKHYAPRARLIVCRDTSDLLRQHAQLEAQRAKVGVLLFDDQRAACAHVHPQFVLGGSPDEIARRLYAGLRALDSAGVDAILVTDVPREGLGEAIADRLKRAAAGAAAE